MLWNFGVVANDGERPQASLIADNWGNLYGTTSQGGANTCSSDGPGCGTVFELSPPSPQQPQWTEKVLWNFDGVDGEGPSAGLIVDGQGNFYGTTSAGGTIQGTAFELSPPRGKQAGWREKVLWNFSGPGDGRIPVAALLADRWGNLYGTTVAGPDSSNGGTVFELNPPRAPQGQWSEKILWSFPASGNGLFPFAGPEGALLVDRWGDLYGTTSAGGANDLGTAFALNPPSVRAGQWSERVLWNFSGAIDDAANPAAGLIADYWGNLYGNSAGGGAYNRGTVFKLSLH